MDILTLPLDTDGQQPQPYLNNPDYAETRAQFSPNGLWVAYESNETGQTEIYVRPFPNAEGGRWRISTDGGYFPRWNRDGAELYYMTPTGTLMAVAVDQTGGSFVHGAPAQLFETVTEVNRYTGNRGPYDIAEDGRFLMNVPSLQAADYPITLLLNWNPEATQ